MRPHIAVVGAGFSGTLAALQLLRHCAPWVGVTLIERAAKFGRGLAYGTSNPMHLLNTPAIRMSAFQERPNDFVDWLSQSADGGGEDGPQDWRFVPRRTYGDYLRHHLNRELRRYRTADRLRLVSGTVESIDPAPGGIALHLNRGPLLAVDTAILAIGNFPPEPPPVADPAFYDTAFYRADPWATDTLAGLDPKEPVLLIGTGLTMVDTAVALLDRGHRGRIWALSRRGLLPQRHVLGAPTPAPPGYIPGSLARLMHQIRRRAKDAAASGNDWRPLVDALRPSVQAIWRDLAPADRARFLRHLRLWWDVHRHRLAPGIADRIDAARECGQLLIRAGRLERFKIEGRLVGAIYRRRQTDRVETIEASRVINCAGPGCDYARISEPLVQSLLRQGRIRPDRLHLGLDVAASCALIDAAGRESAQLFAVGPVTRGRFWEITAVQEIRQQCEALAHRLATRFGPDRPTEFRPVADYGPAQPDLQAN